MKVFIDENKLGTKVPGSPHDYTRNIEEYYLQKKPIEVFGVFRFTGERGPLSDRNNDFDYYLASIHQNAVYTIANTDWADERVNRGYHTWEPINKEHQGMTITQLAKKHKHIFFHWLPMHYCLPINNKGAKHLLTKLD